MHLAAVILSIIVILSKYHTQINANKVVITASKNHVSAGSPRNKVDLEADLEEDYEQYKWNWDSFDKNDQMICLRRKRMG